MFADGDSGQYNHVGSYDGMFSDVDRRSGDTLFDDALSDILIGLDHNYQDITQGIIEQGITTSPIHIGEHTIIGANVIVI